MAHASASQRYAKCAIVNVQTGMALDHYDGKSIQAYNNDINHPNHRWILNSYQDGTYSIVNVQTGMALDHYDGKSIQACNNDVNHPNHRWILNSYQDGTYSIVNVQTEMALDHYDGKSIQAYNNDVNHPNHRWKLVAVETSSGSSVYTTSGTNPSDIQPTNQFFTNFSAAYTKVKIDARIHHNSLANYTPLNDGYFPVEIYRSSNNGALVAITLHPPHAVGGAESQYWHYHAKKVTILASPSEEIIGQPNIINIPSLNIYVEVHRTHVFENCSNHYFIKPEESGREENPNHPPNTIFTLDLIRQIAQAAGPSAANSKSLSALPSIAVGVASGGIVAVQLLKIIPHTPPPVAIAIGIGATAIVVTSTLFSILGKN